MKNAAGRLRAGLAVGLAVAIFISTAAIGAADTANTANTASPAVSARAVALGRGVVTAREQPLQAEYVAYAQVRPVAIVPLRAAETGVVSGLRVAPGYPVTAGEQVATLAGPEIQALLVSRRGALRSARTQLAAARQTLAAETRQLAGRLSTRQSVAAARSAMAAAEAALQSARAQLRAARQMLVLRAPAAGVVIAVNAGNGERVAAGQMVLTLQPAGGLWLVASYYGGDVGALAPGMKGRFAPAAGGRAVAVKVASVFGAVAPDGGEGVGLMASTSPALGRSGSAVPWTSGEWGTVTLEGPARSMVAVPTRALIVDRAKWWVLVRTPAGDRAVAVVPGPTRGWDTFIDQGLEPGERVVVQNAYLEFHRAISRHYTPPD